MPERLQGAAAGVLNTAGQLGTALGVAGLLSLVAAAAAANTGLPVTGARLGWLVASATALASAVLIAPDSGREQQVGECKPRSAGRQRGHPVRGEREVGLRIGSDDAD